MRMYNVYIISQYVDSLISILLNRLKAKNIEIDLEFCSRQSVFHFPNKFPAVFQYLQ